MYLCYRSYQGLIHSRQCGSSLRMHINKICYMTQIQYTDVWGYIKTYRSSCTFRPARPSRKTVSRDYVTIGVHVRLHICKCNVIDWPIILLLCKILQDWHLEVIKMLHNCYKFGANDKRIVTCTGQYYSLNNNH